MISSWSTEKDCCAWEGVHCDNITRRVTEIDLSGQPDFEDVQRNVLKGEMNLCILELEFLSYLDLSHNEFDVIKIPSIQHNITHSSKLLDLDLSYSLVTSMDNLDWLSPHSSLKYLNLTWIDLHKETNWLQIVNTLPSLLELQLRECNLNNFPSVEYLNLSSIVTLDLSSNNFASHLPNGFFNLTKDLTDILLQGSNIHGEIPSSLKKLQNLSYLDLSYNQLQGSIPHSWKNFKELSILNLWSNRLSGEVLIHLSDWRQLEIMNLGENEFSGNIPTEMSQNLQVVILRSNQFEGIIPPQLFNVSYLFHLDLAHNKLSGSLPHSVFNLTHMVTFHMNEYYPATIDLFTKGQDYVYDVNPDRRTIDLSTNSLSGEVPLELFQLVQLQTLNLSHNHLTGTIPKEIGGMKNMESLDLSNNKFHGEIPQSMSLLTFLDYLNLSCNNFNGKIPTGTQLQSFNPSSYIGNPKLCGAPLNNCTMKEENPQTATLSTGNEDDDSLRESLYLGMGVGFAAGFWGICGSLFLIRKWRHAYFRVIYGVGNRLYVTLMVKLNRFQRN